MDGALVDNASDRRLVQRARQKTKQSKRDERADVRAMLATPEGRRVLGRIRQHFLGERRIFNENPHWTSYNAGLHESGLWVEKLIRDADPDGVMRIEVEQRRAEKQERDENDAVNEQARRERDDPDA